MADIVLDVEQMDQFPYAPQSTLEKGYLIGYQVKTDKKEEFQMSFDILFKYNMTNNCVTASKLADNAVENRCIADEAVNNSKISGNSISTDKIQDRAVTNVKLSDGAVSTDKIQDRAVTDEKLANHSISINKLKIEELRLALFPVGSIIMWGLSVNEIPDGWHLCDGSIVNGYRTPDLINRFPRGTYSSFGLIGGNDQIRLNVGQLPKHRHVYMGSDNPGDFGYPRAQVKYDGINFPERCGTQESKQGSCYRDGTGYLYYTSNQGNGNPIDIIPAYTNVLFIMKVK